MTGRAGAVVERVRLLDLAELEPLVAESLAEGLRFLARLRDEHRSGANRFDRAGEALFVVREPGGRPVGVCGLNVDPHASGEGVGRVRRLYVAPACRGRGIGRQLLAAVIEAARPSFRELRLRTDDPGASGFYRALGFEALDREGSTHRLELGR